MCGRFVGFRPLEELRLHFPIDVADVEVSPNYNVAPTQEIMTDPTVATAPLRDPPQPARR